MPVAPRSTLRFALALSCAASALVHAPALAQQAAAPFATPQNPVVGAVVSTTLDEISVSATGVPTPVAQVGSSVTVLTSQVLEQQQRRTVSDALQQVPGLNVVQTGGPGGQTSVFIRGSNSNHVKVLIDGIDARDPSNPNGSFDFGQLLTEDLSRIEVLRGPQSGLYGSDAIGGVISFVTKRGEGPAKASVRLEGGSFGTFNQSGRISGAENGFDYSVSILHLRAAATPVTPDFLIVPGAGGPVAQPYLGPKHPNYYDNTTVSAKLGYQFTDTFRWNSITRFTNSRLLFTSDNYNTFPALPNEFRSSADIENLYTRNEAEWTPFAGFHNIFAINYSNLYNRQQGPLDPLSTPDAVVGIGERLRYEYRGDYQISPGNLVLFGAQRDEERLNNNNGALNFSNGNTGGYGEVQLTPFDRAFLVANVRHDENDAFGAATTYRVAPSYIIPYTETRLKGSVGTGFKAPTLSQLYQSFPPFSFANPNLKPEESFGFDAGLEQPLGDRVTVGGLYYENDFTNLIGFGVIPGSGGQFGNININRARSYGAEAFAAINFTNEFSIRGDYTNTVTKDETNNQELLRRPRHKGSVTAVWTPLPNLTLSGTLVFIGSFVDGNRDFSIGRLRNPGFTIVNLAANYDINETFSIFGRIDNLFDERYQNPTGFLGPGLAVYGGVRVTSF